MAEPPVPAQNYAVVPSYVDIKPARAFTNAITAFTIPAGDLNVSSKEIQTISSALLTRWQASQVYYGNTGADFSNNHLDSATVARILTAFDDGAVSGTLDISGGNLFGNSASPSYQPEVYVVQIPIPQANNNLFSIDYDGWDMFFYFKTGIALSASSVIQDTAADQEIWIGVSDSPTAALIASKIVALWGTLVHKNKWTFSIGSSSNRVQLSKANIFPSGSSVTFNTAGFTIVSYTAGNIDATLDNIVNSGRTVKFNSAGASVITLTP